MSGYTKLFNLILASTIWRAPKETKILWITMLAMANKNGIVEASVPGLADLARLTVDEVRAGLEELKAPDPYSRSTNDEGRRIKEVDGGWFLINHPKYRSKMGADERREYLRVKQADFRARRKQSVNNRNQTSTPSTHTEAYTDTEADKSKSASARFVAPTLAEVNEYSRELGFNLDANRFIDYYATRGWIVGKTKMKDWKAAVRTWKNHAEDRNGSKQPSKPKEFMTADQARAALEADR